MPIDPCFLAIFAQVRPSIWHFESSSQLLWNPRNPEKDNLPDPSVCTFSFVMPFSYESELTKLMTSLIINLSLAVFYRHHFHVKWSTNPRAASILPSSNSKYFSLCPPWSISVALLCSTLQPWPVREKGVCSDSKRRRLCAKAWERSLA